MSTPNVITVVLGQMHKLSTRPIYQTDSGIMLYVVGKGLPDRLQVDFANVTSGENAQTYTIDTIEGVEVPVNLIRQGRDIHAYAVWTNADYSVTRYDICIPVIQRAFNTDDPTPEQRTYIDEAVETCQDAAAQCEANVLQYPKVENGMWSVYNAVTGEWVSTGVPATGPQGIQGPKGEQGDTGPAGPQGLPGQDGTISNLNVAAVELPAGSEPTATYENNLLTLGIPGGSGGLAELPVYLKYAFKDAVLDEIEYSDFTYSETGTRTYRMTGCSINRTTSDDYVFNEQPLLPDQLCEVYLDGKWIGDVEDWLLVDGKRTINFSTKEKTGTIIIAPPNEQSREWHLVSMEVSLSQGTDISARPKELKLIVRNNGLSTTMALDYLPYLYNGSVPMSLKDILTTMQTSIYNAIVSHIESGTEPDFPTYTQYPDYNS